MDAAIIQQCADPSLKPAIVRSFLQSAGSENPLSVVVKGDRGINVLVPTPRTADEAMDVIRQYLGKAIVRVGVTQYPAGVGLGDASDLNPEILDPCENLRRGTALFAKTYRIVVKWYGTERPEALDSALEAWRSGMWDGQYVFGAADPGPLKAPVTDAPSHSAADVAQAAPEDTAITASPKSSQTTDAFGDNPNKAPIRIDLSRVQKLMEETK